MCHETIVTKDKDTKTRYHVMEHVNYAAELLASVTTTHHDAICRWNTPNRKRRNTGVSSQILKGGMHKTGKRKKFN